MPANADEDAVTASYRDGILTVSVGGQKAEEKVSAKRIEVTTAK